MTFPDPASEIVLTTLQSTRGANFWSQRPVTRMDLRAGAYDDISSAQVPGFTERLMTVLPGLIEHRCSIGERGGFRVRLRRGTYAPHIIEHVALELQAMIGHDVGFGRTRGGDVPGEFTLVFEHLHEQVGLRAAAMALHVVQQAFAGTLETVDHAIEELRVIAQTPDVPLLHQHVHCAITGSSHRAETQVELRQRLDEEQALVVDVAPSYILQAGLPFSRSEMAIILDATPTDVPDRYRDPERARQLVSVLADGVRRGGLVVCPAREWEIQDRARDLECRVAVFSEEEPSRDDLKHASAYATIRDGHVWVATCDDAVDAGALDASRPPRAQVAAALAAFAQRADIRPAAPESVVE